VHESVKFVVVVSDEDLFYYIVLPEQVMLCPMLF
jgi:hypothetical protein